MLPIDLLTATATEISSKLSEGEITIVELVEGYLARISKDNYRGVELRAIIETAPRESVLRQASILDKELKDGNRRSSLHGIPVLVKDSMGTSPESGLRTAAGSYALSDATPEQNAKVVDLMLDAGMIILGKANLSAFSGLYGVWGPMAWSPRGGHCKSAYGDFSPSGSSSGSAVAVSAGFAPLSLGGETNGSIVNPAEAAGLFGLKASQSKISSGGCIPVSSTLDCLGPMAKSAQDLRSLYRILSQSTGREMSEIDLSELKLGILTRPIVEALKSYEELFDTGIGTLKAAGVPLVDISKEPDLDCLKELSWNNRSFGWGVDPGLYVMTCEMSEGINEYLSKTEGGLKTLDEIVKWNNDYKVLYPEKIMAEVNDISNPRGQLFLDKACELKDSKRSEEYQTALETLGNAATSLERVMDRYQLDAIVSHRIYEIPTVAMCGPFPICTVPYGIDADGRPFGMYFVSRKDCDETLLGIAASCESIFPLRVPPPDLSRRANK